MIIHPPLLAKCTRETGAPNAAGNGSGYQSSAVALGVLFDDFDSFGVNIQDIVAVLMMAAYFLRMYRWEEYAEEHQPETSVVMAPVHDVPHSGGLLARVAGSL